LLGQTRAFVVHFKLISQVVWRCAATLTASLPYPLQVSRAEKSAPRPSFMSSVANRLCSTRGAEYVDRFICCQRVRESQSFWLEDGWVVVAPRIAWSEQAASRTTKHPIALNALSTRIGVWSFLFGPPVYVTARRQRRLSTSSPRRRLVPVVWIVSRWWGRQAGLCRRDCSRPAMHTLHRLGDSSSMELESDNPTSPSTISTTLNVAH